MTHTKFQLEKIIQEGIKLTPMMQQYWDIKKNYLDTLLMFRMGDFYEVFFEDAQKTSHVLNISLTHRGKIGEYPIPMAGIPHHAASTYIDRLTGQGLKVAICEQVEDPKASKGIVKRAVTQVVSPGLPYDLNKSDELDTHYLASAYKKNDKIYLALIDFTTGPFGGLVLDSEEELLEQLLIYSPKEFLGTFDQWDEAGALKSFLESDEILTTNLAQEYFNSKHTALYIEKLVPAFEHDEILKQNKAILSPIGALSYYIFSTQAQEKLTHIRPFKLHNHSKKMQITFPTLIGLEIFPKGKENYRHCLLGLMDATKTSMGTRKLKEVFQYPLCDLGEIQQRQKLITYFLEHGEQLEEIREELYQIRDIERILAKVSTRKALNSDLINLANAKASFSKIIKGLPDFFLNTIGAYEIINDKELDKLGSLITSTLNDEMGASLDKGNLIKEGAHTQRDELAKLAFNAQDALKEMEQRYREETQINNLKIKNNNVAGYFIEVSKSHINKVPKNFIRRQTLVNSERYQTEELSNFEKEILSSKEKLAKLEREIFNDLIFKVEENAKDYLALANSIALLDVFQSFSYKAWQEEFCLPQLSDKKKQLVLKQAWHPIIKKNIKEQFIGHDLDLNSQTSFALITGPNMAGKTTVMREVAIIQFLAQVGSFVPAKSASLGLCDFIFSRLGAHDNIVHGQSTFMVEMSETAEIIRHATENSLIVLDEIGRGTSTYDGLSIAWALVEHLCSQTRAITLFSTHYHELIELVEKLDNSINLTVKTEQQNGEVHFLYELVKGGAQQSFGLHVAKLAGLPHSLLKRSKQILTDLEEDHIEHSKLLSKSEIKNFSNQQLDMFQNMEDLFLEKEHIQKILAEIEETNLLRTTPFDLMNKVKLWQDELGQQ